jgi:hypothetical protein
MAIAAAETKTAGGGSTRGTPCRIADKTRRKGISFSQASCEQTSNSKYIVVIKSIT